MGYFVYLQTQDISGTQCIYRIEWLEMYVVVCMSLEPCVWYSNIIFFQFSLVLDRRQAIIWTNTDVSMRPLTWMPYDSHATKQS